MPDSKQPLDATETAARAGINERCAPALLHDIRGSMQALFSSIELLARSARSAASDPERLQKCADLARRAAQRHEATTMDTVQLLMMQKSAAKAVDWHALLHAAVEFLRNDLARRDLKATLTGEPGAWVRTDRSALQATVLDILTAVIDDLPAGGEMSVRVEQRGDFAAAVMSPFGRADALDAVALPANSASMSPSGACSDRRALSLFFACRFLQSNGGRLDWEPGTDQAGSLCVRYPLEHHS